MYSLDISYYFALDERDVNELTQLKSLKTLELWRDDIAPRLLSRLEKELPDCNIIDAGDDW
jgi:hypothetical protein